MEILDSQYQFSDDRLSADEMGKDKIINILLHSVPIDAGRLRGYSPKSRDLFRNPFFSYLNVEFYPTLFCTSVPTMLIFESIMIITLKEPQTISIY